MSSLPPWPRVLWRALTSLFTPDRLDEVYAQITSTNGTTSLDEVVVISVHRGRYCLMNFLDFDDALTINQHQMFQFQYKKVCVRLGIAEFEKLALQEKQDAEGMGHRGPSRADEVLGPR